MSPPLPSHKESHRIGSLNGKWAMLFKLALASYPFVLAWAVWVTSNIFAAQSFMFSGERFTKSDGLLLEARMTERVATITEWKSEILVRLARIEEKLDRQSP